LKYSIDTSALIESYLRDFPPDVFPLVWEKLEGLIGNGCLKASEEVQYELEKKDDDVFRWAINHNAMFSPTSVKIQESVKSILKDHKRLIDTRKNRSGADPFVIALAQVEGLIVITAEGLSSSSDRPKIPDVCKAMGIKCTSMIELFREEKWRFENLKA
jgi:hypothetical protein